MRAPSVPRLPDLYKPTTFEQRGKDEPGSTAGPNNASFSLARDCHGAGEALIFNYERPTISSRRRRLPIPIR